MHHYTEYSCILYYYKENKKEAHIYVRYVFAARQCQSSRSVMILSSEKGSLLASPSYDCHYKIKAPEVHQRIRLTLLDYTAYRTNSSWSDTTYRHISKALFTVSNQSTSQQYTSTMQRRSVVYVSERPEIDVRVMKLAQEFGSLILQYEGFFLFIVPFFNLLYTIC